MCFMQKDAVSCSVHIKKARNNAVLTVLCFFFFLWMRKTGEEKEFSPANAFLSPPHLTKLRPYEPPSTTTSPPPGQPPLSSSLFFFCCSTVLQMNSGELLLCLAGWTTLTQIKIARSGSTQPKKQKRKGSTPAQHSSRPMLAPLLLGWVWPSKDVINPYIWANLSHYILITLYNIILYIKKIPKNTFSKFVIFPRIFD